MSTSIRSFATGRALALAGLAISSLVDGKRRRTDGGDDDPRHFAVMYSVNNSPFRYLGGDHANPKRPFKTQDQAIQCARNFMETAAQINAKAKVVDVRKGTEVAF